jgi:hypothetical protein
MVTDNEAHNENHDKLRAANEEKKNKLIEQYGACFSDMSTNNELPPEIESQFLDNILAFETNYDSTNRIPLYDFVGKPTYRKVGDLSDKEITEELNRLTELLDSYQVALDTICDVAERELYRFITEELFLNEINDMHIQGMYTRFIYEEFYPNHEHDICEHSNDFIRSYLDKANDFYTYLLTPEAEKADWHLHFRQAFSSFQLNSFSIAGLNFDTEKARVLFECDFVGKIEGSVESLHFVGVGELNLLGRWDYWCIDSIKLPKNL